MGHGTIRPRFDSCGRVSATMKKYFPDFFSRYQGPISYAIAMILGLAAFQYLFDLRIFLQYFWGLDGPGDLSQHTTGFYAFIHSPWGFPILWTSLLRSPQGLNVYFTDSVPIFAILIKLLAPVLPSGFEPFKIWLVLVYMLQPVSAVALMRAMGQRSIAGAVIASLFSLLLKWFLFRFNHFALDAQFVVILALALYAEQCGIARGGSGSRSTAARWMILLFAAFLIHTYLLAMVFGIFIAAVFDGRYGFPSFKMRWLYRLNLLLLPVLLLSCAFAAFIGLDVLRGVPPAQGFGYFSMNLAGPFTGGNLIQFPASLTQVTGQLYEDQSYLGLGVMGVLGTALFVDARHLLKRFRRCPALGIVLLGSLIFALSSDVFWGAQRIYHYPSWLYDLISASPLIQFRASARFFWPLGYALLFWGLAVLLRKRWGIPLLVCLLIVQWIDLPRPFTPRPAGYADIFNPDLPAWDRLLKGKRALYLYPTYYCGGDVDGVGLPAVLMAATNGAASNTASVSRIADNCAEMAAQGLADMTPGTVHIFTRPAEYSQLLREHPDWCAQRVEMAVCVPDPGSQDRDFLKNLNELALPLASTLFFP
jgi:hypothetical protein